MSLHGHYIPWMMSLSWFAVKGVQVQAVLWKYTQTKLEDNMALVNHKRCLIIIGGEAWKDGASVSVCSQQVWVFHEHSTTLACVFIYLFLIIVIITTANRVVFKCTAATFLKRSEHGEVAPCSLRWLTARVAHQAGEAGRSPFPRILGARLIVCREGIEHCIAADCYSAWFSGLLCWRAGCIVLQRTCHHSLCRSICFPASFPL